MSIVPTRKTATWRCIDLRVIWHSNMACSRSVIEPLLNIWFGLVSLLTTVFWFLQLMYKTCSTSLFCCFPELPEGQMLLRMKSTKVLSEDESPYAAINLMLAGQAIWFSGDKLVNVKLQGSDSFASCLKSTCLPGKFPALGLGNSDILVALNSKGPIWFNLFVLLLCQIAV